MTRKKGSPEARPSPAASASAAFGRTFGKAALSEYERRYEMRAEYDRIAIPNVILDIAFRIAAERGCLHDEEACKTLIEKAALCFSRADWWLSTRLARRVAEAHTRGDVMIGEATPKGILDSIRPEVEAALVFLLHEGPGPKLMRIQMLDRYDELRTKGDSPAKAYETIRRDFEASHVDSVKKSISRARKDLREGRTPAVSLLHKTNALLAKIASAKIVSGRVTDDARDTKD